MPAGWGDRGSWFFVVHNCIRLTKHLCFFDFVLIWYLGYFGITDDEIWNYKNKILHRNIEFFQSGSKSAFKVTEKYEMKEYLDKGIMYWVFLMLTKNYLRNAFSVITFPKDCFLHFFFCNGFILRKLMFHIFHKVYLLDQLIWKIYEIFMIP